MGNTFVFVIKEYTPLATYVSFVFIIRDTHVSLLSDNRYESWILT
jgi:hypothetical protein